MESNHTVSLITHEYVRFWHTACLRTDVMGATQVSTLKVNGCDISKITIPNDVLALQFFSISTGVVSICGQKVPLTSGEYSTSQVHYFDIDPSDMAILKSLIRPLVPNMEASV